MRCTGTLSTIRITSGGRLHLDFEINEKEEVLPFTDELQHAGRLSIEVKRWRHKRSLNANALLWACIGEMADALSTDKWSIYLLELKKYGKYVYLSVQEQAVERLKEAWRETEEISREDGMVNLLCYYGSSMYDTKEFSTLLDGVVADMKDLGIQPPLPETLKASLDAWEKEHGGRNE